MGYGIGLSGLMSAAEAIDVTSNNISNAQTVGYKSGEYVFSDQFFRAQDPQSQDRAGMGAYRMAIRRTAAYGTVVNSQNPLDMAITGPGMFMLAKQVDGTLPTENPTSYQFTRNGQFAVDKENRIVNQNGMYLVGYPADSAGTIISNTKSVMILDRTPLAQQATKNSTINLNLDNRVDPITGNPFNPTQPTSYSQSTSQTVYDDKGTAHTLSVYYKKMHSVDLEITGDGSGSTFTFDPTGSIGTTLAGEQTNQIANTANASAAGGTTQVISNAVLTYVGGGVEKLNTEIAPINGISGVSAGSGYTTTTRFSSVPLVGGSGTGATADITIGSNGTIESVTVVNRGTGYETGDALSVSASNLGNGSGTGFAIQVSADAAGVISTTGAVTGGTGYGPASKTYSNITLTGGSPSVPATANITVNAAGVVTSATIVNPGAGYAPGVVLTVAPSNLGNALGTGFALTAATVAGGTAAVESAAFVNGAAATTATNTISFAAMKAGDSVEVNGLTYTASVDLLAPAVAAKFTSVAIAAGGVDYSGTFDATKYTAASVNVSNQVVFTSVETGSDQSVADLVIDATQIAGGTAAVESAAFVNGAAATTATNTISFAAMKAGDSVEVNGLTYTASVDLLAPAVAAKFTSVAIAAGGVDYSGTFDATKYTAASVNVSNQVVFTSVETGSDQSVADLVIDATQAGGIATSTISGGSGYTSPTIYQGVALTSSTGIGSGATANITVNAAGVVTGFTIVNAGSGYETGDVLTVTGTTLGRAGSGFSVPVTADNGGISTLNIAGMTAGAGYGATTYTNVELTGGSGTGAKATIIVAASGSVISATLTASGNGYQEGDLLGAPSSIGINGTGFSVPVVSIATNRVGVLGAITAGSGYGSKTYSNITLTGGTPSVPATANITVNAAGVVTNATIVNPGAGYAAGVVLGVARSDIVSGSGIDFGLTAATVDGTGAIATSSISNAGSGYVHPTVYSGVALTGGFGTGATADVTVNSSGQVTGVEIVNRGSGYAAGDVLTVSGSALGSAGTGFGIEIASLKSGIKTLQNIAGVTTGGAGYIDGIYKDVPLTGGSGIGAIGTVVISNGVVTKVNLTNGGSGYLSNEILSLSANSVGGGVGSGFTTAIGSVNSLPGSGDGTRGATYNLRLNDGTNLSLTQISESGNGTPKYTVNVDRYSVFATLDGNAVGSDSAASGKSTIKVGGILTEEQTSLGTMAFVGGKNLDSLSRNAFGEPQFDTQFKIDASGGKGSGWGQTINGGVVQFTLNSTNMTGYSSSAQAYANTQDGSATSQLASYNVDSSGKLVAQYDNGQSIVKGQLILAYFNNLEGLIPNGNNTFEASSASGDPLLSFPGDGTLGAIRSKALEQSNVDLTSELVKLMVLQRQYSAVSQATKVMAATLIDDAINIGR